MILIWLKSRTLLKNFNMSTTLRKKRMRKGRSIQQRQLEKMAELRILQILRAPWPFSTNSRLKRTRNLTIR